LLRYFRINDPYRLVALFVLLVVLCLPVFIDGAGITYPELKSMVTGEKVSEGYILYSEIIDSSPPLASWFYGLCDWVFGRSITARHLTAFIILFLQSIFFGVVLIDKKVFTENTFIPALVFCLLTLLSFDMFSLTADLAAFGFILLALNSILTEIEFRVQRDETILNLGLYISLATLFNFSYLFYLPGFLLILILFTRYALRKYLLLLTGFLLPHVVLFCAYYLNGAHIELWNRFYTVSVSFEGTSYLALKGLIVLGAVPLLLLSIALVFLNQRARLTNYQSQVLQAMFLWFIAAVIQIYFTSDLRPQSLLPLVPAFAFFLTHFLLHIRRKRFAEMTVWVLLLGVVGTSYLSRYQKLKAVDYSGLLIGSSSVSFSDKHVLVLEDNPAAFLNNTSSPAFLDWHLSKKIFDEPHVYENVLLVNRLFEKDPPEIILDPENRMEGFLDRIPHLKSQYQKSGQGYWVVLSN
jgi:4-amino-4-deoxy-L-arabinose transferase-like glycosyltransferase